MGVLLPGTIFMLTALSLCFPYWIRQRGNAYGPLVSRLRTPLGNIENVYLEDYHEETYRLFLGTLVAQCITIACVIVIAMFQLFAPKSLQKGRRIACVYLSILCFVFQGVSICLPLAVQSSSLLSYWYVNAAAAGFGMAQIFFTSTDVKCKRV